MTSLRESEVARSKLESMVVDLSDKLKDCHHQLGRVREGGEKVSHDSGFRMLQHVWFRVQEVPLGGGMSAACARDQSAMKL
jgi:hypothetical protein